MKQAPSALALLLLGACTPAASEAKRGETSSSIGGHSDAASPSPPTSATPSKDTCNRAAYAALIGTSEKDPGLPPASASVRRIHPGDQVTMDLRPDRLDIDIDAKAIVTGLRCG